MTIGASAQLQTQIQSLAQTFINTLFSGKVPSDPQATGQQAASQFASDLATAIDTWMQGVVLTIVPGIPSAGGGPVEGAACTVTTVTNAPWTQITRS